MRRILLLVTAALLIVALLVANAATASAQPVNMAITFVLEEGEQPG